MSSLVLYDMANMATTLQMIVLFAWLPSVTTVAMTSEPSCGNDVCARQGYVACIRSPLDTSDAFCLTCTVKRAKCGTVDELVGCNKFCQDLVRNHTIDDFFREQKTINATFSENIHNLKEALNRSHSEKEALLAKLQTEKEDAMAKLSSEKVDALTKLQSETEDALAQLQREKEEALTKAQREKEEALTTAHRENEEALTNPRSETLILAIVLGVVVAGLLILLLMYFYKRYLERSKKKGKLIIDTEKADHEDHKHKEGGQPNDEHETFSMITYIDNQPRDNENTQLRETENDSPHDAVNTQPGDNENTQPRNYDTTQPREHGTNPPRATRRRGDSRDMRGTVTSTLDTQNGCPIAAKLSQVQPTNGSDTRGDLHIGVSSPVGASQPRGTVHVTPVRPDIDS